MTEYLNESSHQNEKPRINNQFNEDGSKTGKVHLPFLFGYKRLLSLIGSPRFEIMKLHLFNDVFTAESSGLYKQLTFHQ
jgi:hypothetical protein